eukprot:567123-Pyramimonas_sp.AAC.1
MSGASSCAQTSASYTRVRDPTTQLRISPSRSSPRTQRRGRIDGLLQEVRGCSSGGAWSGRGGWGSRRGIYGCPAGRRCGAHRGPPCPAARGSAGRAASWAGGPSPGARSCSPAQG